MGSKRDLGLTKRNQKLFAKNRTRMARNSIFRLHGYPR